MLILNEIMSLMSVIALGCAAWAMRGNLRLGDSDEVGWFSRSIFTISLVTGLRMTLAGLVVPMGLRLNWITPADVLTGVDLFNVFIFAPLVLLSVYCLMKALLLMIRPEDRADYSIFTVWLYPRRFLRIMLVRRNDDDLPR